MKKYILSGLVFLLLFSVSACFKNNDSCEAKTIQSEDATMQAYATANAMSVTRHSTGMYYEIINQGSGVTPTPSSRVSVKYTGKLLNGTVFEVVTTPTVPYPIAGFIAGWQIGLPLINKGGTIKLIIPSLLAYGCTANGIIPANSILFFEIELVDVQ